MSKRTNTNTTRDKSNNNKQTMKRVRSMSKRTHANTTNYSTTNKQHTMSKGCDPCRREQTKTRLTMQQATQVNGDVHMHVTVPLNFLRHRLQQTLGTRHEKERVRARKRRDPRRFWQDLLLFGPASGPILMFPSGEISLWEGERERERER